MYATCPRCGVEADITIEGRDKYSIQFNALECLDLQEKAKAEKGGAAITGRCPHIEEAASEAVRQFRR